MACDCRTWILVVSTLGLTTSGCVDRVIDQDLVMRGDPPAGECIDDEDCDGGLTCVEGTCLSSGIFRVTLTWEFQGDLDLHLVTPRGNEINYTTEGEVDGGRFDVDDCPSSNCDGPPPYVENIYFDESAREGLYSVWVRNFDGIRGGPFVVSVVGDVEAEWDGRIAAETTDSDVFEFELEE